MAAVQEIRYSCMPDIDNITDRYKWSIQVFTKSYVSGNAFNIDRCIIFNGHNTLNVRSHRILYYNRQGIHPVRGEKTSECLW